MGNAEPEKNDEHDAAACEASWSQPHVDGAGEGIDMSHTNDDPRLKAALKYGSSEGKRSR